MSFLPRNAYPDVGDMSDISDVSADELARMVEDAGDLDSHIFGKKGSSKELAQTKTITSPAIKQASPKKAIAPKVAKGDGPDDLFSSEVTLPDNSKDPLSPAIRRVDDRGDWLGLKTDSPTVQKASEIHPNTPKRPLTVEDGSSKTRKATGIDIATPTSLGRRGDKTSLIQDLFGPPSWEKKKDDKRSVMSPSSALKISGTFGSDLSDQNKNRVNDEMKSDTSYVPSLGGGSASAGRRSGRPIKPQATLSFDEFDEALNVPPTAQTSDKPGFPDWLGGTKKGSYSRDVDVDKEEMVGALASAQATLGAALARHHNNMHSYMQLLLEEARRMSLFPASKKTGKDGEEVSKKLENSKRDNMKENNSENFEKQLEASEKNFETGDENENNGKKNLSLDENAKEKKNNKANGSLPENAIGESYVDKKIEAAVQRIKINLQDLEVENMNLKMTVESLKTTHELEIASFKRAAQHDSLLWEARIERLQHYCFEIERDYAAKIDKMKENEDELVRAQKARLAALQEERLDEVRRLNELHKVILEQAISVTVMYPQYRLSSSGAGGGLKLPVYLPEKPENEKELVDREGALMEKEKLLAVSRAELEAMKEDWASEKHKMEKELLDREASIKEMERAWNDKKEREEKELNRREGSATELMKQVETMRELAIAEAAELAKERLTVSTERAKLDAVLKSENGDSLPNTNHLLQVKAEVEAGLAESRKAQMTLDQERRRLVESHRRIDEWKQDLDQKERELQDRAQKLEYELERARKMVQDSDSEAEKAKIMAERAEAYAKSKEQEYFDKVQQLDQQLMELSKEKMDMTREKYEIEAAKTRLELLLPELTPAESLKFVPSRMQSNYKDPKAVIMRLKAEKELESYNIPKRKYI